MTTVSSMRRVRASGLGHLGAAIALAWKRDFDFSPGQLVELALEESGPSRLYSLYTGPTEEEAGVLFTVVESGALSPGLASLAPGDGFWCRGPSGTFPPIRGPGVWIANGTGVAPFIAMSRAGLAEGKTLLHGAREPDDFYFQGELERTLGERYVRCRSRRDLGVGPGHGATRPDGNRFEGRLTDYLESRSWDPGLPYELCGSASMVVDLRELLIAKGIPHSRIVSEVYY
jgi:ferredoxin--NADP+ reductase